MGAQRLLQTLFAHTATNELGVKELQKPVVAEIPAILLGGRCAFRPLVAGREEMVVAISHVPGFKASITR